MAQPETKWSIKKAQADPADPNADPATDPSAEEAGPDLPLLETDQFVVDTLQGYAIANLITFDLVPEKYGNKTPRLNILMQLRKQLLGMNIAKSKDPKVTRVLSGFTLDPPAGANAQNVQAYGSGTIKPRNFQEGIIDNLKSFYAVLPEVEASLVEFSANGPSLAINGMSLMEGQDVFKNEVKQREIQLTQRTPMPQMGRTRANNNRTIITAQEAAGPLVAGRYESLNQLIDDLTVLGPKPETYEKFMSMVGPDKEDDAKEALANFFQGMVSGLFGIYSLLVDAGMANPIDVDIVEQIMTQHPELTDDSKKKDPIQGLYLPDPSSGLATKVAQRYPAYFTHGGGENKYCPKIRKTVNSQTCRYHCLDGLAIDDNQILCGEVLWRQAVMDKFSREYRDENGNWVGGYLNKRFEIHRDNGGHPALLKPGTRSAPIEEDAWSLEKRLAEMRRSESKDRGYSSTPGDPKGLYNFDQHEIMKGPQNKLFTKKKDPIAKIAVTDSMFEKTSAAVGEGDPGPIMGNPAIFDKPTAEEFPIPETGEIDVVENYPEPGDITTSDRENWLKDGREFFKGNILALKEFLKSSGEEYMPRVWLMSSLGVPEPINIWETTASTWSLTKEAKKDKPKYTKTVSEDKFVRCKEKVRENSPDLPENAEYGICTKQLGGQPASYHAKKDKKEDKEAVSTWSLTKKAEFPDSALGGPGMTIADPGKKIGTVCTKCGKRYGPELSPGAPCRVCKAPVRDLSKGEQTEATGAIEAPSPKIQSVTDANIKMANGVYCASRKGVSAYGDTHEEALHKLAIKSMIPQAPMDTRTVEQESQEIIDQEAINPIPGKIEAPIVNPKDENIEENSLNLNTPEGLLKELTNDDNNIIIDPTPSTEEVPADVLPTEPLKVEEIGPNVAGERTSEFETTASPEIEVGGKVNKEVLDKSIQETPLEMRQRLERESEASGAGPD